MAFATGVNLRFPALMFATETNWPAVTATPESARLPAPGSVVIFTFDNALTGLSAGSVNPKSAAVNV